jgi:predicted molibdopterin-dependent oxidoreductase YjgC
MKAYRLAHIQRGKPFEIVVDDQRIQAYEGETLAVVLLAAGIRSFGHTHEEYPQGRLFCGMGVCQQCLVTVNGQPSCQACRTLAQPDMIVKTIS